MGIFHRTGAAPAVAARVAAASTVTARAHSIVRRSMYCMGLMLLSRRAGQRFSFLLRLELSATPTRPAPGRGRQCRGIRRRRKGTASPYTAIESHLLISGRVVAGREQGDRRDHAA